MRVLVTGSSGYIGSAIAERFSRSGEVVGIDLEPGRYTTHLGSILDSRLVAEACRDVDVVVHTAGLHAPHVGRRSEKEFRRTNIDGTSRLLDEAFRRDVRRFVLTSTTSVYGCTTRAKVGRALWVTEEMEPIPEDIYDETKLETEALCQQAGCSGMESVVLRMSRCFPEPENLLAFYRLYRGIDRRDVAEFHFAASTVPVDPFVTFNVSSESPFEEQDCEILWNDPWSVIDDRVPIVREAFEQMGWKRPGRIDRVYVIERAKRGLEYTPCYGIEAFLEERSAC